jgi:hypothetical protein
MSAPALVAGAAGRVGRIGRSVTELLLKQEERDRLACRKPKAQETFGAGDAEPKSTAR